MYLKFLDVLCIFFPTDDFDKAQRHARKAEDTDNVATEDEMERRRKVPKRYEATTDTGT